jgi:hypothetical protein
MKKFEVPILGWGTLTQSGKLDWFTTDSATAEGWKSGGHTVVPLSNPSLIEVTQREPLTDEEILECTKTISNMLEEEIPEEVLLAVGRTLLEKSDQTAQALIVKLASHVTAQTVLINHFVNYWIEPDMAGEEEYNAANEFFKINGGSLMTVAQYNSMTASLLNLVSRESKSDKD